MSARLETSAESLKLARLLGVPDSDLHYLADVPAEELRALRERVTESFFDAGAQTLTRVAAAAKLLPSALVASIAQRAFGPLLCARAASAVDASKAIDVARRLPSGFLADVTIELDPRRVADIISRVPESLVVPVAAELGRRQEHVTMGRFLAFVPDHAVAAAMTALSDEALLRTAFVLEHKDRLDHALGLLPPGRLAGIISQASDLDLWPEALDLLEHLSDARRGPIADVVAEQEPDVIAALVRAVSESAIWESLLPVIGTMSDTHRPRLAASPAFHEPRILEEILGAAAVSSRWSDLLPLIDALPASVRELAASLVARQDEPAVAGLVAAVNEAGLWDSLLPLVHTMSDADRARLASLAPFHDEFTLTAIVRAATGDGMWVELVPLLRAMPQEVFTADLLQALEHAADQLGVRAELDAALDGARNWTVPVAGAVTSMGPWSEGASGRTGHG